MAWENVPAAAVKQRVPDVLYTAEELLARAWDSYEDRKARWEFQAQRSATSRAYRKEHGR